MTLTIDPKHTLGRGDQLWLVSGRVPGSDDDTAQLVLADSADDARDTFTDWMINSSNIDQETEDDLRAAHGSACFIVQCEQISDPDAGLEIQRMLVVSTAHLPRQFREWLNAQNRCNEGVLWEVPPLAKNQNRDQEPLRLIVDPIDDYGWRICVTEEGINEYAEAVHSHDPLLALLRLAQKHHCQWLAVDRDGDELDGFSTFED